MSLSVMALFPLCLAVHHSPSSSVYFSKSFSNKVALGTIMAGTALAMNSTVVTLSHSRAVHFIMNDLRISPGKSPRQVLPLLLALQCAAAHPSPAAPASARGHARSPSGRTGPPRVLRRRGADRRGASLGLDGSSRTWEKERAKRFKVRACSREERELPG